MPEIAEKAQGVLMRKVGPLPVVAWAGIGVLGVLAWRSMTGGPSSDPATRTIVDAFDPSLAGDAGGAGGGQAGGSTVTPPTPVPNPVAYSGNRTMAGLPTHTFPIPTTQGVLPAGTINTRPVPITQAITPTAVVGTVRTSPVVASATTAARQTVSSFTGTVVPTLRR